MSQRLFFAIIIAWAVLAASHGAAATSSGASARVALTYSDIAPQSANQTQKLNLEDIFPRGAGRDLMLQNCSNCHEVSLFAILRKSPEAWARIRGNHVGRFPALRDAEIDTLYEYVAENFNPDRPPSKVPPALQYQTCGT